MKYFFLSVFLLGCNGSEVIEEPAISTSHKTVDNPAPKKNTSTSSSKEEKEEDVGCQHTMVVEKTYQGCKFYFTYCLDEGSNGIIPIAFDQSPCFGVGEVSPVPTPGPR